MTRTYRIWQRKSHPERLHAIHYEIKPYASNKCRISIINKIRKIRNRWWKTLRYSNKINCKKGVKIKSDEINVDVKGNYTEFFD